ncbi:MAG: hypothetical protein V3U72_02035 [Candidatus Aenigmarchaeota archaeon]
MAEIDRERELEKLKKRRLSYALFLFFIFLFFVTSFTYSYFHKNMSILIRDLTIDVFFIIIIYLVIRKKGIEKRKIEIKPPSKTTLGGCTLIIACVFYMFALIGPVLSFLNPPGPTFTLQNYLFMLTMGLIGVIFTIIGVFLLKRR